MLVNRDLLLYLDLFKQNINQNDSKIIVKSYFSIVNNTF